MDLAEELLDLKRKIDTNKEKRSRLEGKLSSLTDRLSKEFGCTNTKSAQKLLDSLEKEIKETNELLKISISALKEKYL